MLEVYAFNCSFSDLKAQINQSNWIIFGYSHSIMLWKSAISHCYLTKYKFFPGSHFTCFRINCTVCQNNLYLRITTEPVTVVAHKNGKQYFWLLCQIWTIASALLVDNVQGATLEARVRAPARDRQTLPADPVLHTVIVLKCVRKTQ